MLQADLTVRQGKDIGRRYVIRMGQRFIIGRGRDVQIRIEDEKVSRRHVAVELKREGLTVHDLNSRNGTFLDNKQLEADSPKLARPEDILQIGEHVFHVAILGLDERTRRERLKTQRLDEPLLSRDEFEILGEIGRGATGRVYAAHQKLLDRNVAIKVLRTELDDDEETQERFLREGRLSCKIDSPYVVEVYDIRVVGGRVYLVMELVNGLSAKDKLYNGPLAIPEALQLGHEVSLALHAAHTRNIIHRDIKPANILVTPDGKAKLSDFGIAKELNSVESLTSTGEGLGTLAYVSPEQATEAKAVDPRTDIYSLGATLYHLICGRPPFLPQSAKVLLQILDQPPPPLQRERADCPLEIVELIHKMLEKNPDDRPASTSITAEALRDLRIKHYPHYIPGKPPDWSLAESAEISDDFLRPMGDGPGTG